ncbi:MAG: hypothetical protein JXA44_00765 [Methanospirillaceae archaeon]|nr:hypothetical protein [Methanospirillaceae archaeon]
MKKTGMLILGLVIIVCIFLSGCTQQQEEDIANKTSVITHAEEIGDTVHVVSQFPAQATIPSLIPAASEKPIQVMVEVGNTEGKPVKDVEVKVSFYPEQQDNP